MLFFYVRFAPKRNVCCAFTPRNLLPYGTFTDEGREPSRRTSETFYTSNDPRLQSLGPHKERVGSSHFLRRLIIGVKLMFLLQEIIKDILHLPLQGGELQGAIGSSQCLPERPGGQWQ